MTRPSRYDEGDLSPIFAVILLLVLAASLGAVGYLWHWANAAAASVEKPRAFAFEPDASQGTLRVVTAPLGMEWSSLDVEGCSGHPVGSVFAGEYVTGCAGRVAVVDVRANRVVASFLFP